MQAASKPGEVRLSLPAPRGSHHNFLSSLYCGILINYYLASVPRANKATELIMVLSHYKPCIDNYGNTPVGSQKAPKTLPRSPQLDRQRLTTNGDWISTAGTRDLEKGDDWWSHAKDSRRTEQSWLENDHAHKETLKA